METTLVKRRLSAKEAWDRIQVAQNFWGAAETTERVSFAATRARSWMLSNIDRYLDNGKLAGEPWFLLDRLPLTSNAAILCGRRMTFYERVFGNSLFALYMALREQHGFLEAIKDSGALGGDDFWKTVVKVVTRPGVNNVVYQIVAATESERETRGMREKSRVGKVKTLSHLHSLLGYSEGTGTPISREWLATRFVPLGLETARQQGVHDNYEISAGVVADALLKSVMLPVIAQMDSDQEPPLGEAA